MCVYTAFGQLCGNFLGGTFQVCIGSECIVKPCMCILNELQEFHHENRRHFMLPIHMCRAQALTWYDGHIPTDEIWVKLGGDKGGGSFKMSFQVIAPCTSVAA